jgi:hypothetical protein
VETISRGGRTVRGFALGDAGETGGGSGTVALAAAMTGAAVGLLTHVLKVPLWGSVLAGAGAVLVTKVGIDRAAA